MGAKAKKTPKTTRSSGKKVSKKTPKKKSFTEKLTRRKKAPAQNFHIVGTFPKGQTEELMVVLRPTEEAKKTMGQIKAAAFNRDKSYQIWMGGDLGTEMVSLLGETYRKFMWVSQDETGKAVFDPEKPIPEDLIW